jgi:protein-S-isoprenylcysteine O-methyltransferase Ste14
MTEIPERRVGTRAHLTAAGIGRMVTVVLGLAATAAIFFLLAGTIQVRSAWIYYGGVAGYLVLAMIALLTFFPDAIETVNARGRVHRDVKSWDKRFGLLYTALLLIQPAVAGWDARQGRAFDVTPILSLFALAVTIAAYAFVHWAMVVNAHAETLVRIQREREHRVISSGPYRFVRHPFYISLIVTYLVYPLAVGSPRAFAPALLLAVLFVWRTAREDATLQQELEGYGAYTTRTRYRLVPGIW